MSDDKKIQFKYPEAHLAYRVIDQALKDANLPKDCYDRQKARCFLCGYPKIWRGSLFFWASLAGMDYKKMMEESRRKWRPEIAKKYGE